MLQNIEIACKTLNRDAIISFILICLELHTNERDVSGACTWKRPHSSTYFQYRGSRLNTDSIISLILIYLELHETKGMSLVPVPGNALIAVPIFNIAEVGLSKWC